MRLKEIKPGMAIHCKNDEEKKALLEEAERLGYLWVNGYKPTEFSFPSNSLDMEVVCGKTEELCTAVLIPLPNPVINSSTINFQFAAFKQHPLPFFASHHFFSRNCAIVFINDCAHFPKLAEISEFSSMLAALFFTILLISFRLTEISSDEVFCVSTK